MIHLILLNMERQLHLLLQALKIVMEPVLIIYVLRRKCFLVMQDLFISHWLCGFHYIIF